MRAVYEARTSHSAPCMAKLHQVREIIKVAAPTLFEKLCPTPINATLENALQTIFRQPIRRECRVPGLGSAQKNFLSGMKVDDEAVEDEHNLIAVLTFGHGPRAALAAAATKMISSVAFIQVTWRRRNLRRAAAARLAVGKVRVAAGKTILTFLRHVIFRRAVEARLAVGKERVAAGKRIVTGVVALLSRRATAKAQAEEDASLQSVPLRGCQSGNLNPPPAATPRMPLRRINNSFAAAAGRPGFSVGSTVTCMQTPAKGTSSLSSRPSSVPQRVDTARLQAKMMQLTEVCQGLKVGLPRITAEADDTQDVAAQAAVLLRLETNDSESTLALALRCATKLAGSLIATPIQPFRTPEAAVLGQRSAGLSTNASTSDV